LENDFRTFNSGVDCEEFPVLVSGRVSIIPLDFQATLSGGIGEISIANFNILGCRLFFYIRNAASQRFTMDFYA
jgi:hypothetical protein